MLKITFLVSELGFHICTCGHNTVFMYELQSWLLAKTVQGLRLWFLWLMKVWKENLTTSLSCSLLTYCQKKKKLEILYNLFVLLVNIDTFPKYLNLSIDLLGAGMAHRWERLSLTNVARVWFRPVVICGLSLLLVLVLHWRFFSGFYGFPPSVKANIPNFNLTQMEDLREIQLQWLMWLPL